MSDPRLTWVAPPSWPQAPEGWAPPAGWRPDPAWGPPPDGWVWWQPKQRQDVPSSQARATIDAGPRSRKRAGGVLAVLVVLLAGAALVPDEERAVRSAAQEEAGGASASEVDPAATPEPGDPATAGAPVAAPAPPPTAAPEQERAPAPAAAPLLVMAAGGDGDSWRDTGGTEYRMGLINTPETGECGGAAATAYRKRALAAGFRAQVYATDRYGRKVAVIVTADGVNLNVAMAKDGIADDRYLAQFRHENPELAAQLDAAFASAKAQRSGIWSACRSAAPQGIVAAPEPVEPAGPAAAGDCHPDYATCIPVRGDGSGRGQANDLDCGDITGSVRLRAAGVDPYRLDADGDGVGCD